MNIGFTVRVNVIDPLLFKEDFLLLLLFFFFPPHPAEPLLLSAAMIDPHMDTGGVMTVCRAG